MKRKPDPLLRTQPWKAFLVTEPINAILRRLERDGTVDVVGRHVVFREQSDGTYYDLCAALRGVIEFHQIAAERYGIPVSTTAMQKFAAKLDAGSPIFESDVDGVRADLDSCRRQTYQLRVSQAESVLRSVQISTELEKVRDAA